MIRSTYTLVKVTLGDTTHWGPQNEPTENELLERLKLRRLFLLYQQMHKRQTF